MKPPQKPVITKWRAEESDDLNRPAARPMAQEPTTFTNRVLQTIPVFIDTGDKVAISHLKIPPT
ncbi:MAG TPA: hypothetical protein VKY54_08000, partial [Kiloniellales bacterium]|nr:hypothetical protein [Kiloniellales bacterium]